MGRRAFCQLDYRVCGPITVDLFSLIHCHKNDTFPLELPFHTDHTTTGQQYGSNNDVFTYRTATSTRLGFF